MSALLPHLLAILWFFLVAGGSLQAATYVVTSTTGDSAPGSLGSAFAGAGLSFASDTISFSSLFDTPQTVTMSADFSPLIKTGIFTMAPSALLTVNSGNFSFLNLSGTTTYNVSNVNNQSTSASAIVVNSGAVLSVSNFDFDNMTLAGGTFRNASTLSTTGAVTLGSGGGTLDITSGTTTLLSTISGGNSLTKAGAGALTLSGSNSYTGNTTISGGTINFSADANLGAASGTLTLNGGTLHNTTTIFDLQRRIILGAGGGTIELGSGGLTLLNAITGSGALTKTNGNILTLTGAQTYTGSTSIQGGTLKIESGSLASSSVDIASGARFLFNQGGTFAGNITGSGTFTRSGTGTTILTGAASHTGGTIIESGTLQIGNGGTTGAVNGGIENDGALIFNRSNAFTYAYDISGTGTLRLQGGGTMTATGSLAAPGGIFVDAGGLQIGNGGTTGTLGTGPLTLAAGTTLTSSRSDDLELAGVISGAGRVVQQGNGVLALSGSNSFSGGISLNSGIVEIQNPDALGTGNIVSSVNGGTLRYGAGQTVDVSGRLTGSGPRIDTNGNDVTFASRMTNVLGPIYKSGEGILSVTTATVPGFSWNVTGGTLRMANTVSGTIGTMGTMKFTNSTFEVAGPGMITMTSRDNYFELGPNGAAGTLRITGGGGLSIRYGWDQNTYFGRSNQSVSIESGTLILNVTSPGLLYPFRRLDIDVPNNGTLVINAESENPPIPFIGGWDLTINGVLSGTGSLVKNGSGTLYLTAENTYTGRTVINRGDLVITSDANLGAPSAPLTLDNSFFFFKIGGTGDLTMSRDITIGPTGTKVSVDRNTIWTGTLGGSGDMIRTGSYDLTLTNAATYTGNVTLDSGTTILKHARALGTGNISIGSSSTLELALVAGDSTFSNAVSGQGTLRKTGGGLIILSGSNSYSGGTKIISGNLAVENNHALGTGAVEVEGGIFLIESGFSVANNIVLAGGTFQREITGNLTHAVDATSGLGGRDTLAEILGGTSGTATTLVTSFSGTSLALNDGMRSSNVYSLEGTGTNTFVLQLSIDQVTSASYLGWLDPGTNEWVNAVEGNTGGTMFFAGDGAYNPLTDFQLGTYGVDTANHTVWAVLNHNSEFAIVPEPGTYTLIGLALAGLLLHRRTFAGKGRPGEAAASGTT